MTFTTLSFAILLAITFVAYWSTRHRRLQNIVLLLASYVFYSWWDYRYTFLMLVPSLIDFGAAQIIDRSTRQRVRRAVLFASMASSLGLLAYFKYANWFIDSAAQSLAALGLHPNLPALNVILPIGISFYTFQTMSYTIDVYRRVIKPDGDLVDYLAYVSFFPQLVAGPIERSGNLLPQFQRERAFDVQSASDGARQALWGLWKKIVIADNLALVVDAGYGNVTTASGPQLALATVAFAFQIYADFSAYSDIAVGIARLFGFRLMRNFAFPYFSLTVAEFWRRWHISLSTWFRDYVYVPLGGSRGSTLLKLRNVILTFSLSGLWHGASWNFVIWGALNGIAVAPSIIRHGARRTATDEPGGTAGLLPTPRGLASMLFTFAFICCAWVFFRAHTLSDAATIFARVITDAFTPAAYSRAAASLTQSTGTMIALPVTAFMVGLEWITRHKPHPLQDIAWPRGVRWAAYASLFWAAMLSQGPSGQFLYFQF
jgi:D-alanyl-lipoteichoic acid acyltransferase DltB (MBOAT superfamily)